MMPRRKRPVVGLIVAAVACVSAAFAGENISNSPSLDSWAPRAAVDSAGNFYVVWSELYGESRGDIFFSKYTKSAETWSSPLNLSNSGGISSEGHDNCGIAVDGSDVVHVVWTERTIVRIRSLSGGKWGQAGPVGSGSQLEGAKIAAQGSGNLYIVWWGDDGVVRSRSRVNGDWERAQQVSSTRRSKFADIAVGNNSVMITFAQKGSYYYNAAYVLRNTAYGAGWTAPAVVSPEAKDQIYPDVEFLNGTTPNVIFIYENEAGVGSLVTHCYWTGNGFGSRQVISQAATIHCPSLIEKSGVLVAVWQIGGWDNGLSIYYNYYFKGQWQKPTAILDSRRATYSDAALDPAGFALAVWDGDGEIIATIMTYDEEEPPTPNVDPVADFTFLPPTGSAPLTVNFDASASYDSDGTIAQFDWMFSDGKTASGKKVTHKFATPGTYTTTLTVTDNQGATNSKSKTIEVINLNPVAGFSFLPPTGSAPLTVNFDASASYDPDGTIARYSWIFGDGNTALGKAVTHEFATPGTYTITLTVTDNFGKTNSKSKSINVINLAPVPGFTITSPFNIVPVTVSFDAGSAYDPDGSIVQYDWVFGDGVTSQSKSFSRAYTLPGTFSIKLTVTDNFSKKASLTKTFTLLAMQAPLNIRWESFSDVSLFQSRVVTDVQWDANPANDAIAPVVKYRVFRKKTAEAAAAFRLTAETDGSTFFWRDDDVTTAGQYVYTVTSMDAAGHESLMPSASSAMNSQKAWPDRRSQGGGSSSIRR
ncbi:MAG: PKD domain-containing protein [Candidatus Aminicenantes bacterium]|nr:PKD domain-containing protein [Candidatus Aminicenantes bacterium]